MSIITRLRKHSLVPVILLWLFASCSEAPAQNPPAGQTIDQMLAAYPFIRRDLNVIRNDSTALAGFYEKLWELKQGKRKSVSILHIGDSHIQADFLSGTVRANFQTEFGNAGRGLVFPYRVAKSNEPWTYKTTAAGNWSSRRMLKAEPNLPIGLCGFTLEAIDTMAAFGLKVSPQGSLNYAFNKITVLHSSGPGSFNVAVCDPFNCRIGTKQPSAAAFATVFTFDSLRDEIVIDCIPADSAARRLQIYGMVLENQQPGILYHMVGVNGAEYRHYNAAEFFFDQLTILNPDLVIVSLGTNEGFSTSYSDVAYRKNIELFIQRLKTVAPQTAILTTTPGDSFRRTRRGFLKNPDMGKARKTLLAASDSLGTASWDLYGVMGGYGSMSKWYVAGLSHKDRLHFNKKGYQLQGELLSMAIMAGYDNYVIRVHGK